MKRSLPSMIIGLLLVSVLVLYMVNFIVRFSEVAVVRTFGKADPEDVITEPGFYWKWPWPIQRVSKYDNRIQVTATTGEETPTRDGKNVVLTTTIGWRIGDPYVFSIRCGDLKAGEENIKTRVRSDQTTVIAQYDFSNLVSIDPEELKYDKIEEKILAAVQESAKDLYGIRVESIGIQKLALPKRITETVFEAMEKEREAVADQYISEGESQAKQKTDTAESIARTILAFAERKASEIVAEGERRAAQYNETFKQDEALAMFLLEIENLPKILRERATVILDAHHWPFRQLLDAESSGMVGSTTQPASGNNAGKTTSLPLPEILQQQ